MDFSSSPVRFLKKKDPIYQISTLQSLVMGNYYGGVSVEQLLLHGDTGLGMFAAADGGMRDALSILDLCASAGKNIDEQTVESVCGMAGGDYLISLADYIKGKDTEGALMLIDKL